MNNIDWLKDLRKKTLNFINKITDKDYNFVKYSLSGDLYNRNMNWGLGQNVFVVKILFMLNALNNLTQKQRDNLKKNILKFQDRDGYISDPLIIKLITGKRFLSFRSESNLVRIEKVKRAETRQSYSALYCLGKKPDSPFLHIPYDKENINKFLLSLDWKYPWDAGSHFSHLMFFLKLNEMMFGYKSDVSKELVNYANDWIDELQSNKDGFWYSGETSNKEKINGAMKILTGKSATGIFKIKNHEKIIDGCLNALNDSEACSNFNIVYCLYYCSNISDYRKKEIKKFCYERLGIYKNFYFNNVGGFSFYKNKANDVYYGALITKGLNEPDIHGTVMFIWGITLISKILGLDFLNYKIPLT